MAGNEARSELTDGNTESLLMIQRTAFTVQSFEEQYRSNYVHSTNYEKQKVRIGISKLSLVNFMYQLLPILKWLPAYKLRDYAAGDLMAGLTVGIVCVPQGMAFSLNANLAPVYGLYVSLFPVLVYILMGTSHHLSMGTFAVISIMAANAVEKLLADVDFLALSMDTGGASSADELQQIEWLKAHTALCLLVGIMQVIMGILRLGFVTKYLSTPILRGFTTGAACHVLTSQFKYMFGLEITASPGPLSIAYVYMDILSSLHKSNLAAITVSIVSLIALVTAKEIMQIYKKKFKMPMPIELIVVTGSIVGSHFLKWNEKYRLDILGNVPTGIPGPSLPPIKYFSRLIADAFVIAIVAFVLNISQAIIVASKNNYRVDSNQEFIAYGCGNVVGSFFSCFTACAALARTLILDNTGAKTQLASFIQCLFVLVVLLALGPLFEPLPKITWLVTWSSVTFIGVDIGLLVGVAFAFLLVVIRTQRPKCVMLGHIKNTEIYKEISTYDQCEPLSGFKIFQMRASLYFANADYFKDKLVEMTTINPYDISEKQNKQDDRNTNVSVTKRKSKNVISENIGVNESRCKGIDPEAVDLEGGTQEGPIHTLVIDCGFFSFLDSVGVTTLDDVINRYSAINVTVVLANCKETVLNTLESQTFFEEHSKDRCFPSLHDAIIIRQKQHEKDILDKYSNIFESEVQAEEACIEATAN
ncbi:solute carrier family 26 member 6-like isoform X2 [Anneissia japonica]|uniref:solute carrier family 26 member 6-like isoform X2 n=1 Tax=Anneissia japonica TaxID=1529436 RepID=UPI001425B34E|nr:solute carrier family 26 member 6-like isoform X2 [Anneissia japonica]